MTKMIRGALCLLLLGAISSVPAQAGVFADDLSRCLVRSTTPDDRTLLRKWTFALMSADPDLATMSKVDAATHDTLDKQTGEMMIRLLTDMCPKEALAAIQSEGPGVMFGTFAVLGQYAQGELMQKPPVVAALKNFAKFWDTPKLKAFLAQAAPATQSDASP